VSGGGLTEVGRYIQKGYIRIADIWKLYAIHNTGMVKKC
jgi:hypothetical protein